MSKSTWIHWFQQFGKAIFKQWHTVKITCGAAKCKKVGRYMGGSWRECFDKFLKAGWACDDEGTYCPKCSKKKNIAWDFEKYAPKKKEG